MFGLGLNIETAASTLLIVAVVLLVVALLVWLWLLLNTPVRRWLADYYGMRAGVDVNARSAERLGGAARRRRFERRIASDQRTLSVISPIALIAIGLLGAALVLLALAPPPSSDSGPMDSVRQVIVHGGASTNEGELGPGGEPSVGRDAQRAEAAARQAREYANRAEDAARRAAGSGPRGGWGLLGTVAAIAVGAAVLSGLIVSVLRVVAGRLKGWQAAGVASVVFSSTLAVTIIAIEPHMAITLLDFSLLKQTGCRSDGGGCDATAEAPGTPGTPVTGDAGPRVYVGSIGGPGAAEALPPRTLMTVYFPRGSADFSPAEPQLRRLAVALAACRGEFRPVRLRIRGFTSSTDYAGDSVGQNRDLADRRAEGVKEFLEAAMREAAPAQEPSGGILMHEVIAPPWDSHDEMVRGRLVDRRADDRPNSPPAALNRFARIDLIDAGLCAVD